MKTDDGKVIVFCLIAFFPPSVYLEEKVLEQQKNEYKILLRLNVILK
jgi:hypothetical protein